MGAIFGSIARLGYKAVGKVASKGSKLESGMKAKSLASKKSIREARDLPGGKSGVPENYKQDRLSKFDGPEGSLTTAKADLEKLGPRTEGRFGNAAKYDKAEAKVKNEEALQAHVKSTPSKQLHAGEKHDAAKAKVSALEDKLKTAKNGEKAGLETELKLAQLEEKAAAKGVSASETGMMMKIMNNKWAQLGLVGATLYPVVSPMLSKGDAPGAEPGAAPVEGFDSTGGAYADPAYAGGYGGGAGMAYSA